MHTIKAYEVAIKLEFHSLLTSVLEEMSGQLHVPADLHPILFE
jgi:hypothetical protein